MPNRATTVPAPQSARALRNNPMLLADIGASLTQSRFVISDWKHDYNHHRRSALGYLPPARYAATCSHQ
jgi:hypothetical protein